MRLFRDLRFQLFYWWLTRRGIPLIRLGDICAWSFCEDGLNSQSRILCAGAGNDISFEKALIARYGCPVVLLDPSPTGTATIQRESIPGDRLRFMPIGLAGQEGRLNFQAPGDPGEGSFRESAQPAPAASQFPCQTLSGLMAQLGWTRIDVIKMDIEGFEYGVLRNLLESRIDVQQICVEFHYGPAFNHQRNEMVRMIFALRRAGYDLICRVQQDHTFLRRR
jgi:FkbM family methyltransferase